MTDASPTLPNYTAKKDPATGGFTVPVTNAIAGEVLPANTVPVQVDARNRAWRTFLQNIAVDIAVVVLPVLYEALTGWDGAWSRAYWVPVIVTMAKTAALVVIAYVMRLKKPPVGATQ